MPLDGRRVLALTVALLLHVVGIACLCLPGTPLPEIPQPSTAQLIQEHDEVFVELVGMRVQDSPPPLPTPPQKPKPVPNVAATSIAAAPSVVAQVAAPATEIPLAVVPTTVTDPQITAKEPETASPVDPQRQPPPAASGPNPDRSARDAYVRLLMEALLEHKTYPAAARKARARGVVHLRFSINRRGQVLSSAIASSPGFAILENAALEVLRRADPLPPIPDGIANDQLTVTVPIEYALITR